MNEFVCVVVFLMCHVRYRARSQLIQEISKLAEIIYHLEISTNQSRKLFNFFLDTSAR
jgi:hypothetical protein